MKRVGKQQKVRLWGIGAIGRQIRPVLGAEALYGLTMLGVLESGVLTETPKGLPALFNRGRWL